MRESETNYNKNITPKRVRFADEEKMTNRSFIEMISPLKRKNNVSVERSVTPEVRSVSYSRRSAEKPPMSSGR